MALVSQIMRTTAARLSALYILLFAVCAVALVFYMTSLSLRIVLGQTQQSVAEEVDALSWVYQRGGLPGIVRAVDRRARQPGAFLYLIADPNGRILAGNVDALDPGVLDETGWTSGPFGYQRFGESTRQHRAVAQVLRMPNQMILLVGRDLGEPERFRSIVSRSLFLALGIMMVGGFLIWFFVGRRALKRIDQITEASRKIVSGDAGERLPVAGSGDEFDRLSMNLNGMLERISRLNEGLRQVSDNIAHDLKTPLTRLRNRAEAALSGDKDASEYREALEGTIAEADQLIRTFNAILMISRLEAGSSADSIGDVDLKAIVDDVVELYEPLAEERNVTLISDASVSFPVRGNRELVGQALSNLVDNAIKYSAGRSGGAEVRVSLAQVGEETRLTVQDNGPGIRPEDRERATERFARLEESRSLPGSGLGLSLVKAVMRFHGGRLDLSGDDSGLIAIMAFPAAGEMRG